jgi:hypothetical protein
MDMVMENVHFVHRFEDKEYEYKTDDNKYSKQIYDHFDSFVCIYYSTKKQSQTKISQYHSYDGIVYGLLE